MTEDQKLIERQAHAARIYETIEELRVVIEDTLEPCAYVPGNVALSYKIANAVYASLADRLEASLEREGWKTIDSAPTRGPVLTFIPDPRSPVGGWVNIQTWRGDADGWCGAGEAKRRRAVQPTHWRPLPTAPEGK